ncbi:MAG: response regulator [Ruminococcus sp.]
MTVGRVVPVLNIIKDRSTNMYRVLITDDEKIEREGIKFLLAQEEGEYEIHEAANGRQALNVLRSEEIDFLLTDIKMPHMDGLELARQGQRRVSQSPNRNF